MSIDIKPCPHEARNVAQCGSCQASWCYKCDPSPSDLCHYCAGRGYSTHEIDPPMCQWYALCDNTATTHIPHPILGDVPTCERCANKYERLGRS